MKRRDSLILFAFVIVTTLFSIFNVGYESVHSDEITYLSLVKFQNDPELYSKDILISETLPGVPVPMYTLLGELSKIIDKNPLFFFIYVLTRILLILSVFFLAYVLFKNKLVAYLSVITVILIRGLLNIASFSILDRMVSFFFLAVPLILFSVAFFLRKEYIISSMLLAIGVYLHITTSFFVALLYVFYFLFNLKEINKKVIYSSLIYIIISLPLFIKSFLAVSSESFNLDQWLYFIWIRIADHFFPLSWSFISYLLFFILIVMFIISFKYKPESSMHKKIVLFSLGSLLLFIIGFVFTEIFPVKSIIQASFFRGLVVFRVVAFIYVINYIINSLKSKESRKVLALGMAAFFVLIAVTPFFAGAQKGIFSEVNVDKELTSWEKISIKAKELTPKDSLFITPTFSQGFTFFSERSEFINWKTSGVGAYSTAYVTKAVERFEFVCKHKLNFNSRAELVEECKKGYENLNEYDLKIAKEKYGVTHTIVEKPKTLDLKIVYENGEYVIYEL